MTEHFKVLETLPVDGSIYSQFSASNQETHREGFVVEFSPMNKEVWIGNFQRGLATFNAVINHPNTKEIIVIAGGQAYIIDPFSKRLIQTFGGCITNILCIPEKSILIFNNNFNLSAFGEAGQIWKTRRLSVDGIENLKYDLNLILGEGLSLNDRRFLFQIDINTGKVVNEDKLKEQEFLAGL